MFILQTAWITQPCLQQIAGQILLKLRYPGNVSRDPLTYKRFRDCWAFSRSNILRKYTILNCIVSLIFNHNCSVRELAFGLPLKNSKSSKRLPVVLDSLGFKRLDDLDKQFMYHVSLNSTVLLTKPYLLQQIKGS